MVNLPPLSSSHWERQSDGSLLIPYHEIIGHWYRIYKRPGGAPFAWNIGTLGDDVGYYSENSYPTEQAAWESFRDFCVRDIAVAKVKEGLAMLEGLLDAHELELVGAAS
jgi:hypothetical protein